VVVVVVVVVLVMVVMVVVVVVVVVEVSPLLNRTKTVSAVVSFFHGATAPSGPGPPHCRGFMITLKTQHGR